MSDSLEASMMKRIGELKAEVARLEHLVNYWKVEAETDNARWLRVLEENDSLKAKVETLRNLGIKLESMIDPLEAENTRLKAEVRHQKAMLWALEAYTGKLAVDINPNPWGMRNPHRKNNGCYFDGKPIKKEGQP